jgi:hypothetical protein
LQCLARNLVQFDESFPSHGGLVVQIVLPVDAADIRALLVDLAALEVNIEISADAIATVQSGGFHKEVDAFATFPALVAGKVVCAPSH